jgi:tRNA1Val (adenine37-N6)-methyltransferase
MFNFKQFSIDQTGCAMKVNTDGVLLGALVEAAMPATILDVGTGTGVIALMLAQRFRDAAIEAVEIDEAAAKTAALNFNNSLFKNRLTVYPQSFTEFFKNHTEKKYDLIVSNPPFHIHSLKSGKTGKALARHTDEAFFEKLVTAVSSHLNNRGLCYLILPLQTAGLVKKLIVQNKLHLHKIIRVHSFDNADAHREILAIALEPGNLIEEKFVIYDEPNVYSGEYRRALKDFLTIF